MFHQFDTDGVALATDQAKVAASSVAPVQAKQGAWRMKDVFRAGAIAFGGLIVVVLALSGTAGSIERVVVGGWPVILVLSLALLFIALLAGVRR